MTASNTNRWKLGLFVTVGVGLSIGSLMWLGISQLQRRTTPAYFYFSESVNGLEVGAPVEFLGVELGRVEEIFPAPDRRHIEVRAGIYVDTLEAWGILPSRYLNPSADRPAVSDDIRGQLVRGALTSVAFIELDIYDPIKNPKQEFNFPVPPETIHTVPSTFKSLERGLGDAIERWPEVVDGAVSVLTKLDAALGAIDFVSLNRESIDALSATEALMVELTQSPLVDRNSELVISMVASLEEFRALAAQLSGPKGDVDRAVNSFVGAADAFQEDFAGSDIPAAVAAVEQAGTGLSANSGELSRVLLDLRRSLDEVSATLSSVRGMSDILARDPGALLYGRTPKGPFGKQ